MTPTAVAAQVCGALNARGARYLVIGGIACILHGYVRGTIDVDILIEKTTENAAAVLEALGSIGYAFAREWRPTEIIARPITVIGDDPAVDIFTAAAGLRYATAAARSVAVEVEGVVIPILSIDDLITSKRTGRLQDAADIEVLESIKRLTS